MSKRCSYRGDILPFGPWCLRSCIALPPVRNDKIDAANWRLSYLGREGIDMKWLHQILLLTFTACVLLAQNRPKPPDTLRGVLLEQLHTTHDQEDWFVPITIAVEGLTPEQASWTDGKGNHSIGQLVNHLAFWDERALQQFKGEKPHAFSGNNDETFNNFDSKTWDATVKRLDAVMKEWE